MARVLIYRGETLEHDLDPAERDWRIGRGTGNDIVLADPGKSVSRFHAELRFEQGEWYLIDLASQNGTWVDGQRIQRHKLTSGTNALFGEYRLAFEAPIIIGAPLDEDAGFQSPSTATMVLPQSAVEQPMDTLVGAAAPRPAARPAAPAAAPRAAAPRPSAARRAARSGEPGGGLILKLVRMPKPLLFAGFITICVVVIVAARMFAPKPAPRPVTAPQQTAAPTTPAVAPNSNQGMILTHLKEGKAQMESGHCDAAIRDHFERVLLIDSANAEAAELKARCEQTLANQPAQVASTTPADGSTPGATPGAATPGGATAPGTPGGAATTPGGTRPATTPGSTAKPPRTRPDPRATANQNRYAAARGALAKGDFLAVKAAANAILQQTPGDKEAQSLLGQAQVGLREAATREVEKAQAAEKEGEWDDAIRAYERARDMDPSVPGANPANAREKRRQAGEDAYNKARQYHSLGRVPEAIAWYERAAKWLPSDDARRQTAVTRIAELKKQ